MPPNGSSNPVATSAMPTVFGDFRAVAYRSLPEGTEHLALVMGDVADEGCGAVVYPRGHEGRGIGHTGRNPGGDVRGVPARPG